MKTILTFVLIIAFLRNWGLKDFLAPRVIDFNEEAEIKTAGEKYIDGGL